MPAQAVVSTHYVGRFFGTLVAAFAQLVRSPSHSRRAEAGRRAARHMLWLVAGIGAAIIVLMYVLDVAEIQLMPKRGTPGLWWVRILTDFGKSEYVLYTLFGLMAAVLIASAAARGTARSLLLGLGTRLQFLFFAVLVPALTAFAVSALWPQTRFFMLAYALVICATRLVLLAHHPSDVVAGALVGVIGAMVVRYWFAARRLGFAIERDGAIVALPGPSLERLKRVARGAPGP
jgi:PAP2 superfamily protein